MRAATTRRPRTGPIEPTRATRRPVMMSFRFTPLANHTNHVVRARFSPDGKSVVTASDDRRATVFDAFSGTVLAELIGHEDTVVDAVFSPDGATVVSASPDGTARLWDAL